MLTIKNILVATDFSESSAAALTYGRALAHQFGARLHVLHAVETAGLAGIDTFAATLPQLVAEQERAAKESLESLVTKEDREMLRAITVTRAFETPARAIVDYANTEPIDLIVIGTHGRRGVSHLMMGSVAEKVVRTAPCPVLTVRHPEREFVTPETGLERAAGHPHA